MNSEKTLPAGLLRVQQASVLLAIGGVIAMVVGWFSVRPTIWLEGYLYAWIVMAAFALGCLGFMLLHNIVRASWGYRIIRIFESGARLVPVVGLLGILILLGLTHLYPWADPQLVQADEVLKHKSAWLNSTGFAVRYILFFGFWSAVAFFLTSNSRSEDETGDSRAHIIRSNFSAPLFVLFILTLTFAVTDWVMSLDAHWYSTIFGFWFVDTIGGCALAFATLVATSPSNESMFKRFPVDNAARRDFGNLMLTLIMVWAYFSLSQFLITWSGNLPVEISYYLTRYHGGLWTLATALLIFQFFVPFLLLLSGRTKRTPYLLRRVAMLLIVCRMADLYWTVIPMFHAVRGNGLHVVWTDVASLAGLTGIWLLGFTLQLGGARMTPVYGNTVEGELEHA